MCGVGRTTGDSAQVCPLQRSPGDNRMGVAAAETARGQKRKRETEEQRQRSERWRQIPERGRQRRGNEVAPGPRVPGSGSQGQSPSWHQPGRGLRSWIPGVWHEPPGARKEPQAEQTAGRTQASGPRPSLTWGAVLRGLGAGVLMGDTLQGRQGHVQAAMRAGPESAETVAVQVRVAL